MRIKVSMLTTCLLLAGCQASKPTEAGATNTSDNIVADNLQLDEAECRGQGLPAAITLRNTGTEPSKAARWFFSVKQTNHSDELAAGDRLMSMGDPNRRTDRIIEPSESFKVCSTLPSLPGYDAASPSLKYQISVEAE